MHDRFAEPPEEQGIIGPLRLPQVEHQLINLPILSRAYLFISHDLEGERS